MSSTQHPFFPPFSGRSAVTIDGDPHFYVTDYAGTFPWSPVFGNCFFKRPEVPFSLADPLLIPAFIAVAFFSPYFLVHLVLCPGMRLPPEHVQLS